MYGKDNHKEMPSNTPEPLGKPIPVNVFLDASHSGEKMNYCSYNGIIIYVNNIPISWFYKRKNTVVTSTFGGELIVARIAMEKVKALHTKLQLLVIPIDGPTYMIFDNETVVKSTYRAEITPYKKHKLISWNYVR